MLPVRPLGRVLLVLALISVAACDPLAEDPANAGGGGDTTVAPIFSLQPVASEQPTTPAVDGGSDVAGVTGVCTPEGGGSVADGWARTVRPGWLQLDGNGMRVELHHGLELNDALRDGITTDRLWDLLLGPRYRPGATIYGGEAFVEPYYTRGPATEIATGAQVFAEIAYEPDNGRALPVAVIAPDEATFLAAFPSAREVVAMHRYNWLPLSCGSLVGSWTSSGSEAAETYDANGFYTGLFVAASSIELTFTDDGRYAMHTEAYLNGVYSEEDTTGTADVTQQGITLRNDDGRVTEYDAAFVTVSGGLALFTVNREFTGDAHQLYRSR